MKSHVLAGSTLSFICIEAKARSRLGAYELEAGV